MLKAYLCIVIAWLQAFSFSIFTIGKTQSIGVNKFMEHQTFEGFGTSSAWWSQTIADEETAKEIARLLYDDKTGLGLDIYRYNIGGGEKENPHTRIGDPNRRTESFYVLNEETGEYEYDFTRDENARRMLDMAVEYGAKEVILFCNSPHFSMTASGHASGGLTEYASNLPEENYAAFVDYVLTIADWFVSQAYPVTAISPINEPMWKWGGDWVGQEGCHYTADETVAVLELFALEMQKRNSPYKLSGPESGQLSPEYYEYIDKFFASEILNGFCDTYSGHSYWIDNNYQVKTDVGNKFATQYPDKKLEMSEWCELPLKIDSTTIDSGLYMANIIAQDLNLMNAVSWQSWTAVNGDGLMEIINGELVIYSRYYAYKQFANFIEPGMTRIDVLDSFKGDSKIVSTAFKNENETVMVLINNEETPQNIKLYGDYGTAEIHLTDATHNCENTFSGEFERRVELPPKSITTVVLTK
ncbi:MAG: glycoside hydrolase [Acutalibacteraceae bacterium]|nr:glycoside hydrolase [Acutalibacteraceae bacterium]